MMLDFLDDRLIDKAGRNVEAVADPQLSDIPRDVVAEQVADRG